MPEQVKDKSYNHSWTYILVLCSVFFALFSPSLNAQVKSMTVTKQDSIYRYFPEHSPIKATWMSAALPGLGQYYNGKYWKIPIIYAGFSSFAFFVIQNKYEYTRYKEAYAISVEISDPESSSNILVRNYTSSQLLSQREFYQSNLELSYILTGAFYLLQIIDAAVDAHLYDYNISDDLSIYMNPQLVPTQEGPKMIPGIGVSFKLSKE